MAIIVLAMLIRPLDIPWIQDEPRLMQECLALNSIPSNYFGVSLPFTPAVFGLTGTRGVKYGPFAAWFYQISLGITHNAKFLVWIRTEVVASCTAIALLWLARTLRVSPWLAVMTMLSPWMWIYSRQLWDNSFCIPLSAIAFAAYADFLNSPRRWTLLLTIFSCWALALVHLSAVALIAPIAAHLVLLQYEAIWKFKWSALALIFVLLLAADPYAEYALKYRSDFPWIRQSAVYGWFFPFLGAHHLSATGVGNILGTHWPYSLGKFWMVAVIGARTLTNVAYPIVWAGMAMSARLIWRRFSSPREAMLRNNLAVVSLAALLCQCALDGVEHTYDEPHYFNGDWIIFIYFAWLVVDALARMKWDRGWIVRAGLPIYAASLVIVLGGMLWKIARDGGTRSGNYGTVISEQIDAIRQIARFDPQSPVNVDEFRQWKDWTFARSALDLLIDPPQGNGPRRQLVVRYRGDYPDARIMVESKPLPDQP
jgi:hypothetical protein